MKNRQDIQVLRGIAVLLVVIFHARLNLLGAGYLGVEIFFVLSGFLITSMVTNQIERGDFIFGEFYFRRAMRLLPGAYSTFFITTLLSMWLLTSREFNQFTQQIYGAVTFTSNIVLWRQGSYFGGDADLKPLLHTWSLAIEEQYYLLLPAVLYLIPRRHWIKGLVLMLLVSAALWVGVMTWRPDVAFYLLPTRAWELGIGSLGVFLKGQHQSPSWMRQLFWPALSVLLILPILPLSNKVPGVDAWLVCWATLLIILVRHPLLNGGMVNNLLAKVGDWSYSLYLVHWPIFALAANMWIGDLPVWAKWIGVVLSIVLAWLQYTYIENPIRRANFAPSWSRVALTASVTGALLLVPLLFMKSSLSHQEYIYLRRANTGLSSVCAFDDLFLPRSECHSFGNPKTLVWGDSYAMHLVSGINNQLGSNGLVQATKYVCGPLLGMGPIGHFPGSTHNRRWSEGCIAFNDSVINYLKKTPSIKTVVLSSVFKQYMTPQDFHNLYQTGAVFKEEAGTVDAALQGLDRTVKAVRALGKRVVVIAPPPAMDWDAGRCVERILRGLPVLGDNSDCVIRSIEYQSKRKNVLEFLRQLPRRVGVQVISFEDVLRSGDGYIRTIDGEILFIESGHLSYRGSEILAERMRLGEEISSLAR